MIYKIPSKKILWGILLTLGSFNLGKGFSMVEDATNTLDLNGEKMLKVFPKICNSTEPFPLLEGWVCFCWEQKSLARGRKLENLSFFLPPSPSKGGENPCKSLKFLRKTNPSSTFCKGVKVTGKSQFSDTTFQHLKTLPIQSVFLTTDNLQNYYIATADGNVVKYTPNGQPQFNYNNNRLGKVGKIEVRNPLTILVYYPDLEVVKILDRTLSEMKELNLLELDIIQPKGIALANDNNIWVFDQVAAVLKKLNQEGNILFESRNLNQLTGVNLNPTFLREYNNLIYFSDAEHGLFIFDNFGQLKQQFPLKDLQSFQVINNQVVYQRNQQLYAFSMDTLEEKEIVIPRKAHPFSRVQIQDNLFFFVKEGKVEIYKRIL